MMHAVAALASLVTAGISDTTATTSEESSSNADTAARTTVVVTAVAPRSPLEFITDTKQPRQPVPASDGADYLKTIAGFNTIRNGGTNGDPVLRGMFGSRLNVLANDGSMPGACPDRMDNTLSYVSPETYDLLLVTKGPQTVRWGPGASAGTIRFERKSVLDDIDRPSLRMNANALGGSFGRNDQLLDVLGGAEVGYARLSANRSEADDYEDGDGRVVPSRWEKWNADTALGWTPSANTLIELSAGTGDAEARYAGRAMDGAQFERTSYGLRFEQRGLTDSLEAVEANIFYNHTDHVMDNYTLRTPNPMGPMPMAMAKNVDRRTTGGRVAATWQFSELEIVAGIDAQESRQRERSAMGRGRYAQMPRQTQADLSNVGAFAELAWSLDNSGRVVAGARADRAEATDRRETIGMMPMDNPTAGMTRRETLASGFMRYEGQARNTPVSWFAGLGRVERMPDYWELFSADMGPMGSMNAFSALQPEQTTQLDVGVQYRTAKIDAWLSAYAGRIDDFILFTYRMDEMDEMGEMMGIMGMSSSVEQVDANERGGEAGIELRPVANWKLGASLAYAWAENRETDAALPQIPPLEARFTLTYDNGRWSAGALVRAVDGQDRIALGRGNVVGRDLGETSGFAVLSLNGAYRFSSSISVAAGVDNVLDRTYSEHLNLAGSADFGYPADPVRINEPGRTAWLKLLWNVERR